MTLLLDTHLLVWTAQGSSSLSPAARSMISDPVHDLVFSAVNIWEIVIKNSLGREDFKVDARVLRRRLIENGYKELPVTSEHSLAVASLPDLHRDPFDRILVAQASVEGFTLITADPLVASYSGTIIRF